MDNEKTIELFFKVLETAKEKGREVSYSKRYNAFGIDYTIYSIRVDGPSYKEVDGKQVKIEFGFDASIDLTIKKETIEKSWFRKEDVEIITISGNVQEFTFSKTCDRNDKCFKKIIKLHEDEDTRQEKLKEIKYNDLLKKEGL